VKLLLDTHAWLWAMEDDPRLPLAARVAISTSSDMAVSIVSFWEIAIKLSLGKIVLDRKFPAEYVAVTSGHGIKLIAIDPSHVEKVASLPLIHRDPFDRMIAAQAMTHDMTVISKDASSVHYGVARLWS
jgi:PIN domain nuclease of toxin-antitoxin system